MPFTTTRTVRTVISDGKGPPRVETRTITSGDDGGGGGMNFGGFNARFGGMSINFGGGGGDGGSRTGSRSTTSVKPVTQRGCVDGRTSRKDRTNPFAGLGKQSYDEIVKKCQAEGCLFEDPEFPAEDTSIFFSRAPPRPFEWKRPKEICSAPQYVTGGASRFDVQQGELGDCWLLAAVASLTCNTHLLNRVIIPEQNFETNYYGIFRFRFWHQGEWIEVVVDDRLPTYYDKLVFMHSTDKNEFWSALLEKAYAKLSGSYECLKGGSTSEAMEDFTGGVTETVDLKKAPTNLLNIMMKAHDRGSLMGCSIDADPNQLEAILPNGLVMGHAYSITSVKLVEIQTPKISGKIPLVRVRNPWGNESEWKGAWSDKSAEWKYIPADEKKALGLTFDDDGEFWMSFQDWQDNFMKIEICNLGPESLHEDEAAQGKIRWEATAEVGEWIPRVNAGGCRNYLDTFAMNPQYRVVLTDPDDDEDDLCTILIGLLQKDRRKKRKEGLDMLTIGYVIYKMKEDGTFGTGPLDTKFFKFNASVAKSPSFINMREVCGRHQLSPGTYVIIPSTFEPNQQGEFLLRIFTEKAGTTSEMDEGTGIIEDQRWRNTHSSGVPQTQQPDPYAGMEPPALGFDPIVKEDYKPYVPTYDFNSPFFKMPEPYDVPSGPMAGYQPAPYGQPAPGYGPSPGYGMSSPYGAPQPYQPGGYQPAPPGQYGYDPSFQQPAHQYPYGAPDPSAQAYNNQYNPYQQQPGNIGFNAPYSQPSGAYPQAPGSYSQPTGAYPQPMGSYTQPPGSYPQPPGSYPQEVPSYAYGSYAAAPNPSAPQYPYGQGEALTQPHYSSLCSTEPRPSAPARVPAPPVTEDDKVQGEELKESFKRIAGEDLEVDAYELRDILNSVFTKEFKFDGFSLDVCRSMVAMHDGDLSGKLGFEEFKVLWQDLRKWKTVFKEFDKDNSGLLSSYEMRNAFHASGFRLSNRALSAIILRFSNKKGEIEFDDFVLCAIRLKTMIASFKGHDNKGVASYDIDNFIQTTMYS